MSRTERKITCFLSRRQVIFSDLTNKNEKNKWKPIQSDKGVRKQKKNLYIITKVCKKLH